MLSDEEISWIVELEVKPGKLDKFKELTVEMTESAMKENGVRVYERFIDEKSGEVIIYERYCDSNAAVAHLKNFMEKFAQRFSEMASRKRFIVFGCPSRELGKILGELDAEFFIKMDGFSNFREM